MATSRCICVCMYVCVCVCTCVCVRVCGYIHKKHRKMATNRVCISDTLFMRVTYPINLYHNVTLSCLTLDVCIFMTH